MDKWVEVQLFVETAERRSIARAAEALELSTSAAGRHLANLERRLGARLIERNTRRLFLTEVGDAFYRRCRDIKSRMEEAEALVGSALSTPTGTLRVTGSVSFCSQIIAPLLPEFKARYPKLNVAITATNRYFDLVESGIDVAIRTREHESDSGLVIRRLAETRRILATSPEYLERYGVPKTLGDLSGHRLLNYTLANNHNELQFSKGDETRTVKISGLLGSNQVRSFARRVSTVSASSFSRSISFTTTWSPAA
jgi:DNA-binding transcriptional LysR family regulator